MHFNHHLDLLTVLQSDWYDSPDNYNYQIKHQSDIDTSEWPSIGNEYSQEFRCHCGREYKSKGSLADHRRWECGKDPSFQCPYCEYRAKRKKHLKRHVLCVHKVPFTIEQADMTRIQCIK